MKIDDQIVRIILAYILDGMVQEAIDSLSEGVRIGAIECHEVPRGDCA